MAESDAADKAVAAAPAPASVSEPLVGERCRCCMAPGPAAKDLSSQYDFMGEKEVYADMLLESFDIRLEKIQSAGWTICEVCIGRLRDSSNFKKQVLYSERCLLQSVGQLPSSGDQKISGDSKMKMVKCESMSDDNDASFLDDDYFDLETDIKEVSVKFEPQPSTSELSNDEDIPLSKMTSTKKKVTTRSSMPMLTISPLKRSSVQKTPAKKTITLKSGVKITSTSGKLTPGKLNLQSSASMKKGMGAVSKMLATASKLGQSPGTKMVLKPGQTKLTLGSTTLKRATVPKAGTKVMVKPGAKLAAAAEKGGNKNVQLKTNRIHLSRAVLQFATAVPFIVKRRNLVTCCFQCPELRQNSDSMLSALREHMKIHEGHIPKAARGVSKTTLRVDITDLVCKICNERLHNLDELESHLTDKHDKLVYKNNSDILVPYKLDTNQCQVCGIRMIDFECLDKHMETHFWVDICEVCGRGFMDSKKLSSHNKETHGEKKFVCEECGVPFLTEALMKRHVNYTHKGIGANRCWKCPELRFKDWYKKMVHMRDVHGAESVQATCETCGKTCATRSRLRVHMLREHGTGGTLYRCTLCDKGFLNRGELERHNVRVHAKVKLNCAYCGNDYSSSRDLSRHMARFHADCERRCICSYCGQPCENRYKLAQHVKTEHSNAKFEQQFT